MKNAYEKGETITYNGREVEITGNPMIQYGKEVQFGLALPYLELVTVPTPKACRERKAEILRNLETKAETLRSMGF